MDTRRDQSFQEKSQPVPERLGFFVEGNQTVYLQPRKGGENTEQHHKGFIGLSGKRVRKRKEVKRNGKGNLQATGQQLLLD